MKYFTYQGDHEETQVFGLRFLRGQPAPVNPETHATAARKLAANADFKEVFDGYAVVTEEGVVWRANDDHMPARTSPHVALEPQEPESDDLEALRQDADSMGLKVDGRWGESRLRQEIEAARG